jgi:hypothetical protein
LIQALSPFKFLDSYTLLLKILEHYRESVIVENLASEQERGFFKTLLAVVWCWVRLIVLRGAQFQMDAYLREISQFVDEADLQHHEQ